jgi:hypothetical protein
MTYDFWEALEWMTKHEGREMLDSDGDRWKFNDPEFLMMTRREKEWNAVNPFCCMALTFTIRP